MTHLGWDIDATAIMITGRIMDLDVQKRTRDAMRAIVVSECERFASQTQDTIEALDRQLSASVLALSRARLDATDDLAQVADVAQSHADAHIETIRSFASHGIDRYTANRADERERGLR